MSATTRLLFVLGCLLCLLAVASALPAADPRLDGPGVGDAGSSTGDWESIDTPEFSPEQPADDRDGIDERTDRSRSRDIEIDGAIEPGNEVRVEVDGARFFDRKTVEVNGETVGETNESGRIDVHVPYAEKMNVAVVNESQSRTVDVETTAAIETLDGAAPARDLEIRVSVGSTPVPNAMVSLDGTSVTTTDDEGKATVELPETAGPVELRAERGPVAGEHTIDVPEPTVRFVSPLVFPGSPALVEVSADGAGVANASVSLANGESATTGGDGRATLWVPIADEATVTAEVGEETVSATVGELYLRLTAVVVLVPGFLIGATVTYLRLAARRDRRHGGSLAPLVLALAAALAGIADALRRLTISWPTIRWPSVRWPRFSMPRPGFGDGLRSLGVLQQSLGTGFASLLSFDSADRSSDRTVRSLFGRVKNLTNGTGEDGRSDEGGGPELALEPLGPRRPRAEVRAAWHAFLDRLGVEDRTTKTPGHLARRAIAAGFPGGSVRRLVTLFRDVEYGNRDPSPDRVVEARATIDELLRHDPDVEGDE